MSNEYGTIKGAAVDAGLLDQFSQAYERDWSEDEAIFSRTAHSAALFALETLSLSTSQIEALERRAHAQNQPFDLYIRRVLQNELLSA
jgi:predicted DNA binding CopG/RHH family protein